MSLFATSRLDAVNTILRALGETPVADLVTESGPDIEIAEATLDQVTREVQNFGWEFNTGLCTYTPDVNDQIQLPATVLRFESPGRQLTHSRVEHRGTVTPYIKYVKRQGLLFDRTNNTNEFAGDVTLKIVEYLDWDDLPEAARTAITMRAARRFADRSLGDPGLSGYTRQDEADALFALRREDVSTGNRRIFDRSTEIAIDRGSPLDFYP